MDSVAFADEIVVVDSYSTDGTWELLQQREQVKAFQHPFRNFTEQKNFALQKASYNWVYFLDADERVTSALQQEILSTLCQNETHAAYWNYRAFMYRDERLHFSGWQTDKVYRLFRKDLCRFTPSRIVHETLEVNGTEGKLREKLIHYCFHSSQDYRAKMVKYGRMKAREAYARGVRWNPLTQWFRTGWKFFNHYLIRLGILDGKKGWVVCYLNALGVYERYEELKRLQNPGES